MSAFSPWAPKNSVQALLRKLGENEAWKMFNTAVDETETVIDESRGNGDRKEVDDNDSDDVINNTNVDEALDDVDRGEMMTERNDANDTLTVMQTLSEDDIQRLRDVANKNRVVTESDEEALLNQSSDATSSDSAELNFTGLSDIDARNDETEEAKANNSGKKTSLWSKISNRFTLSDYDVGNLKVRLY